MIFRAEQGVRVYAPSCPESGCAAMEPSSIIVKLVLVLVLVAINAYFVATEFALVAVRRTRIEQRLRGGDKRARYVSAALDEPDDFISAAQLGITVASIAIGYIAEDSIHDTGHAGPESG